MKTMVALLVALFLPFAASAQGIVSAADPRAAAAGVEILRKGGSATDAAIATMLALNVVEPQSAGIGGGAFFVQYDAKRKATTTVDGREAAPMAADSRWFYADGKPLGIRDAVPGGRSVGVPGTLRAMALAHRRGGKLPWAALFEPAIRLAREGFAVSPRSKGALGRFRHGDAGIRAIFYDAAGKPLDTVRNPLQADLLARIARLGPDSFYVGPQAAKLVATVNNAARNPSKMTLGDLAAYEAKERPVLCGSYRRHKICSMGPPSSGGLAVLMILKQLERFDMAKLGKDSPVAWHLFAESSRLAYADRDMYLGDPDYVRIPLKGLLDSKYIARRSALISATGSMATIAAGTPPGAPPRVRAPNSEVPGTTSLSVADGAGNVAQVTTTIESPFGSGLSVDGTMLNNELTDFDIVPERDGYLVANRVEGGKRPRSSMAPTIVYGPDGAVRLAVGAAGGSTIIAQVSKAIIGVVDWKLSAQDAVALGLVYAPGPVAMVEKGTEREAMIPALQALGEKVQAAPLGLKANAIERVGGRWAGAADPRSEGVAMHQDGRVPEIKRFGAVPSRPSE
ncbi:gamma-glutamyltransferase family protein [Sphingomonas psychrotolerans]|uniref:Gamma-glutamyltransferase n=1 Tax=Sphingomonas psychrotolerans TaxID=1327635 RepID=A0A2K8MKQ9_9SPHN|nr:gamma-glutamyltransferase family protein [Sphingomonas psychrotolerans]ATY33594.1 gamma-glutamyltransferase [Sphingomonas psychrotolerans]